MPIATLPGMRERTVTINGLSKTYSVTGWRVGWTIAPPELTMRIRKVHDFLTVGAAAPLRRPRRVALSLPDDVLRRAWPTEYRAAARPPARVPRGAAGFGLPCPTAPTT